MKRVQPDPQNVYAGEKRTFVVSQPQYSIFDFPTDILVLVLQRLRFKDVASLSQTCAHFYKTILNNEVVWSALFQKHFPNLPRFEPLLSWQTECELQRRCTRNIIAGLHSFHTIPIGQIYRNNLKDREFGKEALQNFDAERATIADRQGASEHQNSAAKPMQPKTDPSGCFGINPGQSVSSVKASCIALDEGGNILIGYENGAVTILNPKTGETEFLCCGETAPHYNESIRFLICEEGLYITCSHHEFKVWDAKTKKMTWSFGIEDGFSHIEHMKFVEGQLLVSSAQTYGASATTTIRIWDPKSTNAPIILSLDRCPTDITLCGKSIVAVLEIGAIQVIDLESQAIDIRLFRGAPFRVYSLTEKILFLCDTNGGKICIYSLDDPKNISEIYLWGNSGIPSGFKGEHASDRSLCSLEELSLFFNTFISKEFELWDSYHRNKITKIIPQQVYYDIPCVFHRGKIYYFCSDKEAILCINFTASNQDILQQLVQMLEESDKSLYYAVKIIERMPEAVQAEIKKNYSETSTPLPQASDNAKVLKRTQNFKDELFKLITVLEAESEVSSAAASYTDKNCLRQAILKYLESSTSSKPAS